MAPLPAECCANMIVFLASRAEGRLWALKEGAVELDDLAAQCALHLAQPAMKLDRGWPWAFRVQWYGRVQGLEGGIEAVDILGVEAHEAALAGNGGEHVVKSSGLGFLRQARQVADHVMELRSRLVVLVDGGIEEGLAAALDLVLVLEGRKQALARAEVGN